MNSASCILFSKSVAVIRGSVPAFHHSGTSMEKLLGEPWPRSPEGRAAQWPVYGQQPVRGCSSISSISKVTPQPDQGQTSFGLSRPVRAPRPEVCIVWLCNFRYLCLMEKARIISAVHSVFHNTAPTVQTGQLHCWTPSLCPSLLWKSTLQYNKHNCAVTRALSTIAPNIDMKEVRESQKVIYPFSGRLRCLLWEENLVSGNFRII